MSGQGEKIGGMRKSRRIEGLIRYIDGECNPGGSNGQISLFASYRNSGVEISSIFFSTPGAFFPISLLLV